MHIAASAPGKLVLLGEYAVLEGAPALVMAVDRRATATLTAIAGNTWEIVSPTLALEARLRVRADGVQWCDAVPDALAWVATLIAAVPQAQTAWRVELDSAAFYLDHAGARSKLGLGSSAALTVALLGALHASANLPVPTLDAAIAAHRAIQHGRGSGIDIAASLAGGLLRFQLAGDSIQTTPRALPAGLGWRCAYSGRPTSTTAMLATVAAWQQHAPGKFTRAMDELATISARGIDALASHDAATFLAHVHGYAEALARFGQAAGADIVSAEHRALGQLARDAGCIYKSCGAGGGDVGVTFGVEDYRLERFTTRARRAGYAVIELAADRRGLNVVTTR